MQAEPQVVSGRFKPGNELPPESISFLSKARVAEYELKIAAATRILLA